MVDWAQNPQLTKITQNHASNQESETNWERTKPKYARTERRRALDSGSFQTQSTVGKKKSLTRTKRRSRDHKQNSDSQSGTKRISTQNISERMGQGRKKGREVEAAGPARK